MLDLNGKSILITGGTGSFGKMFTRLILARNPDVKRLVIFSRDEQKHFNMAMEFPESKYPAMRYFIGDVRDKSRLERAFEDIDIVIKKLLDEKKADSAVIISESRQHPEKALKIKYNDEGEGQLVTYYSDSGREVTPIARQSYTPAYFRANVIAFRPKVIFDTDSLTGDLVRFHIIPQEHAIDIDNNIDFAIAEYLRSK